MQFQYTIINTVQVDRGSFKFQIIFDKEDVLLASKFSNRKFICRFKVDEDAVEGQESPENIDIAKPHCGECLVTFCWHPNLFEREIVDDIPRWVSPVYSLGISHSCGTTTELVESIKKNITEAMKGFKEIDKDKDSCWERIETVDY